MTDSSFSNQEHLQTQSYRTKDKLLVRIETHERYTKPKVDLVNWVLDQIDWQGSEVIIDVGCGAGAYAIPAKQRASCYIAADLSYGMLADLPISSVPRINLDVQNLPLAGNVADVVLANHMLYHVANHSQALSEIGRILRPGGCLLAATNSRRSMGELGQLFKDSVRQLDDSADVPFGQLAYAFSLENGRSLLAQHFRHVEKRTVESALVFPAAQPALNYLETTRDWYEPRMPAGCSWDGVMRVIADNLQAHIAEQGEFRVSKLTGVFIGTNE